MGKASARDVDVCKYISHKCAKSVNKSFDRTVSGDSLLPTHHLLSMEEKKAKDPVLALVPKYARGSSQVALEGVNVSFGSLRLPLSVIVHPRFPLGTRYTSSPIKTAHHNMSFHAYLFISRNFKTRNSRDRSSGEKSSSRKQHTRRQHPRSY